MAHAEASARTVEAAVTAAAAQLGLRSDQVDVEVLEDPVPSTFGYIGTPARVRVTPRSAPVAPNAVATFSSGPASAASVPSQGSELAAPATPPEFLPVCDCQRTSPSGANKVIGGRVQVLPADAG